MHKFVLDAEGNPVPEPDVLAWGRWFEQSDALRRVAFDDLGNGVKVSTVFLGLDHSFCDGAPVLWETMVFGGPLDDEQDRYTSLADARTGHAAMLERVKAAIAMRDSRRKD